MFPLVFVLRLMTRKQKMERKNCMDILSEKQASSCTRKRLDGQGDPLGIVLGIEISPY